MIGLKIQKEGVFVFSVSVLVLSILSFLQFFTLGFEWHDAGSILYALSSPEAAGHFRSYLYDVNYLAEHSSYILILLTPFFSAFPFLEHLILFQILTLSVGILILKQYFRSIYNDTWPSIILAIAFLFNPYVIHTHLYPHFEIIWVSLLSGFLFFSLKKAEWPGVILLVLTLTIKEDSWIYALGACWILADKISKKRLILYVLIIFSYAALIPFLLTPFLFSNKIPHFAMHWGKSPNEFLIDILSNPFVYTKLLFSGQSKYLALSVLGLPFLTGWRSLPGWGVAILWMSSITLDRAFLSFYYGLPIILLLYYTIPFSFLNIKSVLTRFGFGTNWIYIPAFGLLFVSLFLSFFPGNYISRGPTLPKLQKATEDWKKRSEIVDSLLELRSECNENVFSSFVFGAYLYCGKNLKLPFKDWGDVVSGAWEPDLVVLSTDERELNAQENSSKMREYFESNKRFRRDSNRKNMYVWRRIRAVKK